MGNRRNRFLKRELPGALAISAIGIAGLVGSYHHTEATEVGVRTKKLWDTGVVQEVYAPGQTYFFPPVINDWHKFDTRMVTVEMALKNEGDENLWDEGSLAFKTKDGNDIDLDIIFTYRVDPQRIPHIVEHVAQSDKELREKIVRVVARSKTRDFFGGLSTEEFYTALSRNEAAELAKGGLQTILDDYGVIVDKVATKDYRWGNEEYADAIQARKNAEARTNVVLSQTIAQTERNAQMMAQAEGEYNKIKREADGSFERAKLDADADYARQGFRAEAIKTEGRNQAEAITKHREAMVSAGGETLVKMEVAKSLQGKEFYMIPMGGDAGSLQFQTLDLNDLFSSFGLFGMTGNQPILAPKEETPEPKGN